MLYIKHFPVSNALGKMHINLIYSDMVMCYMMVTYLKMCQEH